MIKFLPVLFIFILGASLIYEAILDTPTYDEPANMAAAFTYVYTNDYRLYPDNPPLIKLLAGLILLPVQKQIHFPNNLESYTNPKKFDLYAFGRDFLYKSSNNVRQIVFLERLPNILFTLGLGMLLYLFAKALYGMRAGLLALLLYSLDPNIRGHGHILAFDIPLAFFVVSVFYFSLRFFQNRHKRLFYGFLIVAAFSFGILTKFTMVFFLFVYIIGLFLLKRKDKAFITLASLIILFSLVTLWSFGVITNYNTKTLDYAKISIIESAHLELKDNPMWKIINALPVPYYYKAGIQTLYVHNIVSQPAYLLGEVRAKNDWFFYFPASFLLKTPISTLLFIAITLYMLGKEVLLGKKLLLRQYFPFAVGFSFLLLMMLFSHVNNVFRYLFPTYVLFILGVSQIVGFFNLKKPIIIFSSILLFGYMLATSILSFPYDLSYTNEFTGVPQQGHKFLSDSEIDWGQDLERLAKFLKENKLEKETITLSYLGTADPLFYGIRYKPLRFEDLNKLSGTVAISVTNLTLGDWQFRSSPQYKTGVLKAPLDDLRAKKPIAVIGKSIFVYDF